MKRFLNKKLLAIVIIIIVVKYLSGCGVSMTEEELAEYRANQPNYSYENVDATITDIDMKYWFAINPRWEWQISVEYDGLTYTDNGWASGGMNKPSFADSKEGDLVKVVIMTKTVKGNVEERKISGIR